MSTFVEIFKTLLLTLVTAQVLYLFIRKTFAGKCIMMCFKIIGEMFRLTYLILEHTYKFLYRQSNKFKETKKQKQPSTSKKTASGETVIDFNKAKTKKSKPEPSA